MISRRRFVGVATIATVLAGSAAAEQHDPVILTVTGLEEVREYSLAELRAIGIESFETTTIWSDGAQKFTGVPLVALLEDLGIQDGTLSAKAINDYVIDIPVSDGVEDGPILAFEINGKPMSVREKGPLWLVYPYDHNPDYRSEVIYSRSVWQLEAIEILP